VADKLVRGLASFIPSEKPYDWLGPGIYFWEADYQRAWEWAQARCRRAGGEPLVVGAAIDLGNCLDLLTRTDQELVRGAYDSLTAMYDTAEKPLPVNENSPHGGDRDRRLRTLDCAVISHLHQLAEDPKLGPSTPFDTVRGMLTEGHQLYPGSGFHEQSHIQIAVRTPDAIKGVFLPPELGQSLPD
jgi:hypothetical protein